MKYSGKEHLSFQWLVNSCFWNFPSYGTLYWTLIIHYPWKSIMTVLFWHIQTDSGLEDDSQSSNSNTDLCRHEGDAWLRSHLMSSNYFNPLIENKMPLGQALLKENSRSRQLHKKQHTELPHKLKLLARSCVQQLRTTAKTQQMINHRICSQDAVTHNFSALLWKITQTPYSVYSRQFIGSF